MPKMTHPNAPKRTVEVSDAQVALYKSQGWRVKESAQPAKKAAAKKQAGK